MAFLQAVEEFGGRQKGKKAGCQHKNWASFKTCISLFDFLFLVLLYKLNSILLLSV